VVGRVLVDRFELLIEAARGGMGSVWRGRDLKTGQMVAIKVLSLDSPSDQVRFEREASVLAGLHHPNIVRYVSHGASPDGVRFLVQEWVDGITLSTQLSTIGATADDAVKVAIGVADALAAAHAHGIVHRDVKPANIILDAGDPDRVKLVDFGIARMEADAGVLTRAGVLVGTPSYMAPEQARGSVSITPAADVWALGCVLYEAMSGRKAFAGRTPEAIRAKALLHEPERLEALCPELSLEVADYIHTLLRKRVVDRPASGAEVAATLRRLLPAIARGPIRRTGQPEQRKTEILAKKGSGSQPGAKCFVLVSVPPAEKGATPRAPVKIDDIAGRHNMTVHPLDDGSVLLEAAALGDIGAVSSAYAAMELQAEIFDGAVSVFGQAFEEGFDAAVDRGAQSLADVTMASLFAEAVGAEPIIPIDDVIAELLSNEALTLVNTEVGRAIRIPRAETA